MIQKKNILDKIVKKNYNNILEEILEEKSFDENVKSTLLSILYKIEVAYKDIETVKKNIETKEEYITKILKNIKEQCNSIKILNMSEHEDIIPKNKTYIIDKNTKSIISYPIERKLLYAIFKISKKECIIKGKYTFLNETLSELINVGNCINMVEPLRDFNGYSWSTIPQEIESIDHNLIYQNLRILVGDKLLNKWVNNNEFIIDYFETFKEELQKKYDKENVEKIIEKLSKISILLTYKYNIDKIDKIILEKEIVKSELQEIQDRKAFVEKKTKRKLEISNKIKEIDTIINSRKLLEKEYNSRNEQLPLEKKIFSMRILSKILDNEKEQYLKEIEELNKILNPQKFVTYKKELEEKYYYLEILDEEDKNTKLDILKKEFQMLFLELLKMQISKIETKQEIEKVIYDFRYYLLIPYDYKSNIEKVEELQEEIEEVSKIIVNKAIKLKAIEKVSQQHETNYNILKNIFHIRIIKMEDAYLKIINENDKYFLQIFDENIFEEKIEIQKPNDLLIKLNKKVSIVP